jgi:hypothetical protein
VAALQEMANKMKLHKSSMQPTRKKLRAADAER